MERNPDVKTIWAVVRILRGQDEDLPEGFSPSDIANMKYLPTVSVDVERSFSTYKLVLTDRRHRLTEENIRRIMVTNCYYNASDEIE